MIVGCIKEIKSDENRVALTPGGAEALVQRGHKVLVETQAGVGSGFADDAYVAVGAEILPDPASVCAKADLLLKVKEPLAAEYPLLRRGLTVFTYFHFAASEELTRAVIDSGCMALAYETLEGKDGSLPLLTPMSEVAGRMSVLQGAKYLERPQGGRGVLISGVPGVAPANVVILGAGVVGTNAAKLAAGLGARVYLLDVNLERLRYLADVMPPNVFTLMSNPGNIREALRDADLVISGVLLRGAKAPKLVRREHFPLMKPGAVIVDVAIDQGGSTETSRVTTHKEPIYEVDGIIHYCVANMPGAHPMTSTLALTNATLPWVLRLADLGPEATIRKFPEMASAANILNGKVVYPAVAECFGLPLADLDSALAD